MDFTRKTRVARRLGLFAVVLTIVIGSSLPVVHAISQDPALQPESMSNTVDRSKKGDQLRRDLSEDAVQKPGAKQMDLRPRVTRLVAVEAIVSGLGV